MRKLSSSFASPKVIMSTTDGVACVSVPVLSNTTVSAVAVASRNLPPFTEMSYLLASLIAESIESGIDRFKAQEKSTIRNDSALVAFLVKR